MVNGQWLMQDGEIRIFDEAQALANAKECAQTLRNSMSLQDGEAASLRASYLGWHRKTFGSSECPACSHARLPNDLAFPPPQPSKGTA
jgi:hypothetical protein